MQSRWLKGVRDGLVLAAGLWSALAMAVGITGVSPQGEVAQVSQVVVRFGEAVVPFGDPRLPDPVELNCRGATPQGSPRWTSDREWVLELRRPLPPGTRCEIKARADWKPLAGTLTGPTEFRFSTGGPAVQRTQPWSGARIDEDQLFLLELTGPVVEAELPAKAWCEVEGLAERLPVKLAAPAERDAILKARRVDPARTAALVLGCGRPLPPQAKLRLVWGKGILSAGEARVPTTVEQRFNFQVRPAFTAEFSCERERANAPCMPIRSLVVRFSSPVPRDLALQARLQPAGGGAALAPKVDKDDSAGDLSEVRFSGGLTERTRYQVVLPAALKDASGRPLANAASFPLAVATGEAPPIAKFAAAPFGVVEWKAEPLLPVTLRHVQGDLRPAAPGGQVRIKHLGTDAEVIAWYRRLRQWHETRLSAKELGLPQKDWTEVVTETDEGGRKTQRRVDRMLATRELPLLARESGVKRLELPQLQGGDPRPFEVVGIPLAEPGYQVVEIESRRLGEALLDKAAPMYVRTGVLLTNLGVHFKQGRENAAVWVTTLDRGRPVAQAEVAVSDCRGQRLWAGRTDDQGLARIAEALPRPARCDEGEALFVSARKADERGVVDMAFVVDGWAKGIEPWRFNLPTSESTAPDLRAHTVFDRTLMRAGETVSMKHFVRRESLQGVSMPAAAERPTRVKITHEGSGDEVVLPIAWSGERSATSSWNIPGAAKLGQYRVELDNPQAPADRRRALPAGDFRVEAFRVPLLDARLSPPRTQPVAPAEVLLSAQLNWMNGGPVAAAPLRGSALLRPRELRFAGYEDWRFDPPRELKAGAPEPSDEDTPERGEGQLVADKLPLTTDREGAAAFRVKPLPPIKRPSELLAEVSFNDPNGEVQTVATTVPLWPSAVVLGLRTQGWVRHKGEARFHVVALDTAGRVIKGQEVEVRGRLQRVVSTRKRLVGGFYAYDNRVEVDEIGALCSGRTDDRGLLLCQARLDKSGQVELIAAAKDAQGNPAQAAATVWVAREDGQLWFEQDNDDRIDVLPERRRYEPGETARLQVRMPFRDATALVAVEREGVIDTRVVPLRGDDPTVELKIDKAWAPNVYVSVLVVRGRIRDVPWTSFFSWGWKAPFEWARAFWVEGREYQAPTAMVDLARPSFKLGVAALQVGLAAHELQVQVQPDKPQVGVRGKAQVRVKVTQGGQPVAGTEVAFAAVDEGLLALRPNDSWQLLQGLLHERAWGVQTSTAQSEIIGRRHYGRKAVPAGGGGGRGATRELFDTLLLWQPRVALDAKGEAVLEVTANDSLTSFRLVAVADDGAQRFGTGSATLRVTQDLQVLSGLPPLVRDGDRFVALVTLRNTTAREMKLRATLQGTVMSDPEIARSTLNLPPQELVLPAGGARELQWPVDVPAEAYGIAWELAADEQGGGGAKDRMKTLQLVQAAVPLRVWQATLAQLDGSQQWPVAPPADALPGRGGLGVGLQPRLSGALPGVRRYFETYPFACLEQKVSKAVGLRDAALWKEVANAMPSYLDADGLASYFPPRAEDGNRGSDRLSAYLLAATHEAGFEIPAPARARLLDGLTAFVEGRIERRFWSPRNDLDVRKLAAIEALSRHGRAQARHLASLNATPNLWPTAAVIDWLQVLRRVNGVPDAARRIDEAQQVLRGRLSYSGTTLRFSTEADDFWWWLMDGPDANAARLILAVLDDPGWKDELPRLVVGTLGRQNRGAWLTTTANLWGSLALDKFGARFESTPVTGRTRAGGQQLDWKAAPQGGRFTVPWAAAGGTLALQHEGTGKPWVTLQSLAAVPLTKPMNAGYTITRTVSAVEQKDKSRWSRGDVLRVKLEFEANADMTWVVVADPVPGGATILGSGLGRDSQIATQGERKPGTAWAAYEERSHEAFRAYYEYLPKGRHVVEYTVRLNNPGRFALPPSRVEAMYAPETFGEAPNAAIEVAP